MLTTSQVADITGISTRTLQYYDEINLLKPSALTPSGYRLYNDETLQELQQILFFKELGFKLKEIKEILQKPEYDRIQSFKKQKELLLLKRNRIDRLVELLSRLEKGEKCMSFKEFDLSGYIEALESFKNSNEEEIIKHWGSIDNFNLFIQKAKEDESNIAQLAIQQYGSVEKYTEAMKYNMEHFSQVMEQELAQAGMKEELLQKNQDLYAALTMDLDKDAASEEIQNIVREIVTFTQESLLTSEVGEEYWNIIIQSYRNDISKAVTDTKYGKGAADFIVKAFRYYFHQ
ncbi:MerR family transcriptional regulator [Diplocloster agilis]|uniref:MerR family transcriptional regulator n=1 Tax=Diplocloster agilis TaxID=2850323 RepID=A0A949JZI7_9FIRM|nr:MULTISPECIES: MerR family transcriptional regulator [Lachnospiraceae]MBU9736060.1 MerR family transcriptional regulator [Diplocloster agilis]MCU6736418.1 MerR family transcriptional regulator [Suonthocola fibrivorans]SCJ90297.1 Multidrug transporter activation protein [uncultured Clostridium sp.]